MNLEREREVYRAHLDQDLEHIVKALSSWDRVERVSVFGSYAKGIRDLFTDLDVLVLLQTSEDFLARLQEVRSRVVLHVDVDFLCYTPEEWQQLKTTPFFQQIRKEEKVLYEKKP